MIPLRFFSWKEKILWKTRFEKERRKKALLPSSTKRFYSLNFSNYVLTYSIETEESMQDSFSRYAPRGSGLSLCRSLFNARLGSSSAAAAAASAAAAAAAASLTKRRFSKSPSVLTITRVSSYPWCETRQGSKIPLGDYFSLATLLPSRLSTLHLSLSPSLSGLSANKDPNEYYRSEIRFLERRGEKLLP